MRLSTRRIAALVLILSLTGFGFDSCQNKPTRPELITWMEQGLKDFEDVVNIFQSSGADTSRMMEIRGYGYAALNALKSNGDVVGAFATFVDSIGTIPIDGIKDPSKRTYALAALAIAKIAFRRIANSIQDLPTEGVASATDSAPSQVAKIKAFGKSYVEQCRASGPLPREGKKPYGAGQYVPMSYCKQYPNNTQVETSKRTK